LEKRIALAFNALGCGDQPPVALPVDSPESGSSQSVGTTFVPDTDEAIMSTALASMHDRQDRLTSLLHHLTVEQGAPDQESPMTGRPASWAREPPRTRRNDRTLLDLQNRTAHHDVVPSVNGTRVGWQFARLFVIGGVTAALVGWGTVLLLGARKAGNQTVQAENSPQPVVASVLDHDNLPQENTEPLLAVNLQPATGVPPPMVHENPPQANTESAVTTKAAIRGRRAAPDA
jgi:hypothetical protein